jgi:hypothetical protein
MSLLYPWALSLSLLVAVPLALHLLRRDTRQRVAFPAIRYLERAQRTSARALRIRDRLLMLVRVSLLAVLAAAAAAPLVGRGDASDHWPVDVAIVIDNTASMNRVAGEQSLLETQLRRAQLTIANAGREDRFWILPAVGDAPISGAPADEAASGVQRVEPTDGARDLAVVVREAARLLPARPGRRREIQVLSDFQATSFQESLPAHPADVDLVLSEVAASPVNIAITGVLVEPRGPEGDGAAVADLRSFESEDPIDTVEARLVLDGETVAIARTPAHGPVAFRLPSLAPGEHDLAVEIPPSGLRVDDHRAFVLRSGRPPSVASLGGENGYVARALATLEAAGRIVRVSDGPQADAVFVEGLAGVGKMRGVRAAVRVLIPPADALRLTPFNAALELAGIPWRLSVQQASGELDLEPSSDVPGLDRARVRRRFSLHSPSPESDSVVLRTADGEPWLVRSRIDGDVYMLLASPLDPESTSLPVDAAMVPFAEALLFRWSGLGGEAPHPTSAGESVVLPADADSVVPPAGSVVRVDGNAPYVPLRAGLHRVHVSSGASRLAVVTPASESDLRGIGLEDAAHRLGDPDAASATTDAEWLETIFRGRRGGSALPGLLMVLVCLAVAEVLLTTPGRDRARAAAVPRGGSR